MRSQEQHLGVVEQCFANGWAQDDGIQYENYECITINEDLKSSFRVLAQEKSKIKRRAAKMH